MFDCFVKFEALLMFLSFGGASNANLSGRSCL